MVPNGVEWDQWPWLFISCLLEWLLTGVTGSTVPQWECSDAESASHCFNQPLSAWEAPGQAFAIPPGSLSCQLTWWFMSVELLSFLTPSCTRCPSVIVFITVFSVIPAVCTYVSSATLLYFCLVINKIEHVHLYTWLSTPHSSFNLGCVLLKYTT